MKKRCCFCKVTKDMSEFSPNHYRCKECNRVKAKEYRNSEKGRDHQRQYWKSDEGKKVLEKYRESEKGRKTAQKYIHSEKGKQVLLEYNRSQRIKRNKEFKARSAVNKAVASGILPKVSTQKCTYCYKIAQDYHHYKGYEKEYWLIVIPTCKKCHRKLEKEITHNLEQVI